MAEREVIREFLSRLGFQVDMPSFRNWIGMLRRACISAGALGATIAGVVVAMEALVIKFARGMEQLYYSSIRTKASVANMKAMEFALGQIGVEAGQARALLEHLGSQLRVNPATEGLLKMLGVETEGRDRVQVVVDLIRKLKTQFTGNQYMIGASFAERLLGIDEQTYYQLTTRLEELEKGLEDHNKMLRTSGVDADEAARASREFMNELRGLWAQLGLVADRMAIDLLPMFREFNKVVISVLGTLQKLDFSSWEKSGAILRREWGFFGDILSGIVVALKAMNWLADKVTDGLGWLLAKPILMMASRGADGHGGIATPEAMRYAGGRIGGGTETAGGFPVESREARAAAIRSALYMLRAARGDEPGKEAFYDREIGDLERKLTSLGGAPAVPVGMSPTTGLGTRSTAGGITATFQSEVHISGVSDPEAAAAAAGRVQQRVYGDAVRNLSSNVR